MADRAVAFGAAELAARESFGRLATWLAWQWRDLAAAEDALADALVKALEVWPRVGVPAAPDAWLLTVAKRQLLQIARHEQMRSAPAVLAVLTEDEMQASDPEIPDARLKLLFVCAHPAINEKVRVPLMLQMVLGLQVSDFAPAMLSSPSALAQRLVRAKQKIRDTGLRFEEPDADEMPERLQCVLESIYGAFGLGLDALDGAEARISGLVQEALYLGRLLCQLLPDAAEAKGLCALMLFCVSRRAAKTDAAGRFVPLAQQNVELWERDSIAAAEQLLWQAAQARDPGPFQMEAAVQSAHCHRLFSGETPWRAIAQLYQQINAHFPTLGSQVAGAVALAEAGEVAQGLAQLSGMPALLSKSFQPWWVARAHLLAKSSDAADRAAAQQAYASAIGLTSNPKIRAHLQAQQMLCSA